MVLLQFLYPHEGRKIGCISKCRKVANLKQFNCLFKNSIPKVGNLQYCTLKAGESTEFKI